MFISFLIFKILNGYENKINIQVNSNNNNVNNMKEYIENRMVAFR